MIATVALARAQTAERSETARYGTASVDGVQLSQKKVFCL